MRCVCVFLHIFSFFQRCFVFMHFNSPHYYHTFMFIVCCVFVHYVHIAQVVIFVCSNSLDRFLPYSAIPFLKFQLDFSLPFVQHFRLFFRFFLLISPFSLRLSKTISTMATTKDGDRKEEKKCRTELQFLIMRPFFPLFIFVYLYIHILQRAV